jgi:hypothetical protein
VAGKLKLVPDILRLKARRCGVAGSSGIQWRCCHSQQSGRRKRGLTGGVRMAATQER